MAGLEIPTDLDLSNLNQKEKLTLLDKVNIFCYIQFFYLFDNCLFFILLKAIFSYSIIRN